MSVLPSTYQINLTLNDIKNNSPVIALFTSNPGAGGTGTEVSGGSYSRRSITFGSISSGTMSNSTQIAFSGMPPATITHYGIYTGSNLRVYGALNSPITTISGSEVRFNVGQIPVTLSGS